MKLWRTVISVLAALSIPLAAGAAPAGKVVIAQGVDPTTLDMMNQQETPASNVGAQIFDTLIERDANLKIVPALATELPKLVAPTVWEVRLRKGVKFHNGEEFNAESVKFSLERVANSANKLRGSSSFAPIDRVEIVDPSTVRVHTKKPWPIFVNALGFRQATMRRRNTRAGTPRPSRETHRDGAYKFVRWSRTGRSCWRRSPATGAGPRSRPSSSGRSPTMPCEWPRSRTRSTWPSTSRRIWPPSSGTIRSCFSPQRRASERSSS